MALPLKHSIVSFTSGDVIFKDGDSRMALFIVQKGQIAIFKMSQKGERLPLGIIGSGEYLGETGLLEGKKTHATFAVALTDVDVIKIPSEAIDEQLKTAPQWLVSLCRGLSQKLRRTNDLVRRNRIADESLDNAMIAVQENEKKRKSSP